MAVCNEVSYRHDMHASESEHCNPRDPLGARRPYGHDTRRRSEVTETLEVVVVKRRTTILEIVRPKGVV